METEPLKHTSLVDQCHPAENHKSMLVSDTVSHPTIAHRKKSIFTEHSKRSGEMALPKDGMFLLNHYLVLS